MNVHDTIQSWMPSANLDSQVAHFFVGAFVILAMSQAPMWAWLLLLGWIVVKEYAFDLIIESDTVASSSIDAAFYLVGGAFGSLTYWGLPCEWFCDLFRSADTIRIRQSKADRAIKRAIEEKYFLKESRMTDNEKKALTDIRDSLRHLSEVAAGAQQPTRAILQTGLFITVQKVRSLLGESDPTS